MCSFVFSSKEVKDIDHINEFTKLRGPDCTDHKIISGYNFIHNLLSITGEFTKQPIVHEDVVCLFNGEIYNYNEFGDYDNDSKVIIPLYKEHGMEFIKLLDGEFSIVLVDLKKDICIVSSDVFKTKPLWYSLEDDSIGISTYRTPLERLGHDNIKKFKANTTVKINLQNNTIIETNTVFDFDVKQHKDSFDDWNKAFENSIKKRTEGVRENIFLGLSSGYDSGVIACELKKQNIAVKHYSVIGSENMEVLNKRWKMLSNIKTINITPGHRQEAIRYIKNKTEDYKYTISSSSSDYNEYYLSLTDDNGSGSLSVVCNEAKHDGYKIFLSGSGADEIFSDYGFGGVKKYNHSNFGGLFPEDLSKIFPWNSFYNSSQESYLAKDEYVAGSYGIEGRFPFLDKYVVQEFLWLTTELKNAKYKSVLFNYLKQNNFPFKEDEKIGF